RPSREQPERSLTVRRTRVAKSTKERQVLTSYTTTSPERRPMRLGSRGGRHARRHSWRMASRKRAVASGMGRSEATPHPKRRLICLPDTTLATPSLPQHVVRFIEQHIHSVLQLEILLLLRERGGQWSPTNVAEELRITEQSAVFRLRDLHLRKL